MRPPERHDSPPQDVLVVEDDVLLALDLEQILRDCGVVQVRTTDSVPEAMAIIDERVPDFAFLDVKLGAQNSFEIAHRLVELAVPIAFVTGYDDDVPFHGAFEDVLKIRKPYDTETIRQALGRAGFSVA